MKKLVDKTKDIEEKEKILTDATWLRNKFIWGHFSCMKWVFGWCLGNS